MATLKEALTAIKAALAPGTLQWAGGTDVFLNVIVDTDDNPHGIPETPPYARIVVMGGRPHGDDGHGVCFWNIIVEASAMSGGVHGADHGIMGDAAGADTHTVGLAMIASKVINALHLLKFTDGSVMTFGGCDPFSYDGNIASARINYEALLEVL